MEVRMNDCSYIMTKLFRQGNQSFNGNVSQVLLWSVHESDCIKVCVPGSEFSVSGLV